MIDYAANRDKMATLLTIATHNRKEAEQEERLALANYHNACVAYGRENPHALAHKKVKCVVVRRGSWDYTYNKRNPDMEVTLRGRVALYGTRQMLRNYNPSLGEWFVLSASGQTAYSLDNGDWTLDN